MKKIVALVLMLLVAMPISIAQEGIGAQVIRPYIRTLVVLGKGIAISSDDPTDFEIVKGGIARVKTVLYGEETELAIGVLWVGDTRYKVKDLTITNETVEGNLYSNNTQVGSLSLTLYVKQKEEVWVGVLTVNDKDYNVYILQVPRKIKPLELAVQVTDYCRMNPGKCRAVAKAVGKEVCEKINTTSCREKIKEFCKDHPTDPRCKAVFISYCALHPYDTRCREELKNYCVNNPTATECAEFCKKYPLACGRLMKKAAVERIVRERVKAFIRKRRAEPLVPQIPVSYTHLTLPTKA